MGTLVCTTDALTEGVDYFDPEHYLINTIRRATAHGQDIFIAGDELGELTVLGSSGEYFARTDDMARLCSAHVACFNVEVLASGDGVRAGREQPRRDVSELLWQAGFHASEGRLMEGCYRDDVVRLDAWPNLSRLPRTPHTVQLCALLTRHATSVVLAGRLVDAPRSELFQFYSAARCAGLTRTVNRSAEEPRLEPYRNRSLLSTLFGKIAGL